MLILMAGVGLDRVCKWIAAVSRGRLRPAEVAVIPAVALALIYAVALPYRTAVESKIQHDIEDNVRTKAGDYLGQVVKPGQSVTTESSGYLGWDTNGTWYDFPGLESPTVVETIRKAESGHGQAQADAQAKSPDSLLGIADLLRPDWLVLRPGEADGMALLYPDLMRSYRKVREFSVPDTGGPVTAGGFSVLNLDRAFIVYRRID